MPSTPIRQNVLLNPETVVIKVGTALLTKTNADGTPGLNTRFIGRMAGQIAALKDRGIQVILVSSGAVGAGCAELGLKSRPTDVTTQQACAAIGQQRLMTAWHQALKRRGSGAGQILLSYDDFDDRERYLNMRNCVTRLMDMGLVPVLNENDSVAVDEIRFGDNDHLAALITNTVRADALIILTGVDGLLDELGKCIDLVDDIDGVLALTQGSVHGKKSSWGSGGMHSKLQSVRKVVDAGEVAVIANGKTPHIVTRVLNGERFGTVFAPAHRKLDSRGRWIFSAAKPTGSVTIDDGAVKAITERSKSLLAKGIVGFKGVFSPGDVIIVNDLRGMEIARGMPNYSSQELAVIAGHHSEDFDQYLPRATFTDFINRDNLVVNIANVPPTEERLAQAAAAGDIIGTPKGHTPPEGE